MSRASRNKGKLGEREVRDALRRHGFDARRGLAAAREPDLVHSVPGVHLEVKRRETYELDAWIAQATQDSSELEPIVVFRKSRQPWRAVVNLDFLLGLLATTNHQGGNHAGDPQPQR